MKGTTKAGIAVITGAAVAVSIGAVVAAAKPPAPSPSPTPTHGSITFTNTITVSKTSVVVGGKLDFTAKVEETSPEVKPLSGVPVTFLEEGTHTEGTTNTDANGTATMEITFSTPGTYQIRAVAKSTQFCGASSSVPCPLDSGSLEITVTNAPPPQLKTYDFKNLQIAPSQPGGLNVLATGGTAPIIYIESITVPRAGKYAVMLWDASSNVYHEFVALTFSAAGTYSIGKKYVLPYVPAYNDSLRLWNGGGSAGSFTITGTLAY